MNFFKIRAIGGGPRDGFEELCCQIFRMASDAPRGGNFRRIRGAGGDGGVEATWRNSRNAIWGLQSKFFSSLDASEKRQMRHSLERALTTYPELRHYTFCLPIQLTGRGAGGKGKKGQSEKLERWIAEWRKLPTIRARKLKIDWWDSSELSGRLQAIDPSGGRVASTHNTATSVRVRKSTFPAFSLPSCER